MKDKQNNSFKNPHEKANPQDNSVVKANPDERLGKTRKTLQGLNSQCVRYIDDNNVFVRIKETNEIFKTTWDRFKRGLVRTDLSKVHSVKSCDKIHPHEHTHHNEHTHPQRKNWLQRLWHWILRIWHRIIS